MSPDRQLALPSHVRSALDPAVLQALTHPLRLDILAMLSQQVASPRDISEGLSEPLANVAYHMRTLRKGNLIELVRTEQRRGAVEHYYRARQRPFFSDSDWATIPIMTRRAMFDHTIGRAVSDISRAGDAGGFDHVETHVSRTTLALDERGWSEVTELLADMVDRALEIQAERMSRMLDADEGERQPISSQLVVLHFRNPER